MVVQIVAASEAVEEPPHALAPRRLHALGVDVVAERCPSRVRESDLDRAPRIERRDLLSRENLLAGANRWRQALVHENDAPGLRAVEKPIEHALARWPRAAVRPSR